MKRVDEAIALLRESQRNRNEMIKTWKLRDASSLIEKLIGIFAGLRRGEEKEFAKLVQYTQEFLRSLHAYEFVEDKSIIIREMEPIAKAIAIQAKKIASLSTSEGPNALRLRSFLDLYISRELSSKRKAKRIILEHALLQWQEREAQEFSVLINYIDNYIRCLEEAQAALKKNIRQAIEQLNKAKTFGIFIVKQAEKLGELNIK